MFDEQKLEELAADAFARISFESIEVVERRRSMDWDEDEFEGKPCKHGVGAFFGVSTEDDDAETEKFSFHCLIQEVNGEPEVVSAYVYDCRTGNEIASLEVEE